MKIFFDMATVPRAFACKWILLHMFENNLDGLHIIFNTNLPYYTDRLFLNEYLSSNTALKMQHDFKCIFLPKMDQSLRTKILWTT